MTQYIRLSTEAKVRECDCAADTPVGERLAQPQHGRTATLKADQLGFHLGLQVSGKQSQTEDAHGALVGEILNDFFDARARGEAVSAEELLAVHPELADELRSSLEVLGELGASPDRIDLLISHGVLARSTGAHCAAEMGPYKILGTLGRGGMGIVLRAHDESLDRTVAVKFLRPELADEAECRRRFTREAKAAAGLKHDNIVEIHAVGESSGVPYIVMEHVNGPSLAGLIQERGPLPSEIVRAVFRGLLAGLAAAHQTGLIHRDVKSSNILLEGGTRDVDCGAELQEGDPSSLCRSVASLPSAIKLADFGLARMLTAQTRLTLGDSILGTPEYMSPEQARGDEEIDHRSDLYSAGVVLYEMLTGRVPFKAETPTATLRKIIDDDPPDPRKLYKSVDSVLASLALRLMAKRPEERFASAEDVVEALNEARPRWSPERRRRLRHRLAGGLLAGSVLLAAAWAAWLVALARPPITDVRVDPEAWDTLQVRYGDDAAWHVAPWPVFDAYQGLFGEVELLDLDGGGMMAVAVGLRMPFRDGNLFLLNTRGTPLSLPMDLSDKLEWSVWSRRTRWGCRRLTSFNLDGEPGDEIVAVAGDVNDPPTWISIVDPRTCDTLSTFRHPGGINGIEVEQDFFDPNRPAILAWGFSNLLHVSDDDARAQGLQTADWTIVSVLMVLDPRDMDGVGPARTDVVPGVAPARPHAYAFLNLPGTKGATYARAGQQKVLRTKPIEVATIGAVEGATHRVSDDSGPWYRVCIGWSKNTAGGATLVVDRDLEVRDVIVGDGELLYPSGADWCERWHVIVREGKWQD